MVLAGLILLVASILKMHQLITEPIVSKTFWESWMFFVIQIPLEFGLAIWLLSGLFRKAGWLLSVFAFGVFIAATAQKVLVGAESCGCFGAIHVNPQITLFSMDIPFFIALMIFRPKGYKLLPPPWPSAKHFFSVAVPTFIFLGCITAVLMLNKVEPVRISDPPPTTVVEPVPQPQPPQIPPVVPEPNVPPVVDVPSVVVDTNDSDPVIEPAGPVWSILEQIDIGQSLSTGMAIIFFYHSDCPDCREAVPVYSDQYRQLGDDVIKLAFIEIPPYGPEDDSPMPQDTTAQSGKLAELEKGKKWWIGTPYVVVTIDGVKIKEWELKAPDFDELLNVVFSGD